MGSPKSAAPAKTEAKVPETKREQERIAAA
jgi:hypothetical protein